MLHNCAYLMVDPAQLAGADHTVFVSGDDAEAKQAVTQLLKSFGWTDIIDLGDSTAIQYVAVETRSMTFLANRGHTR